MNLGFYEAALANNKGLSCAALSVLNEEQGHVQTNKQTNKPHSNTPISFYCGEAWVSCAKVRSSDKHFSPDCRKFLAPWSVWHLGHSQ